MENKSLDEKIRETRWVIFAAGLLLLATPFTIVGQALIAIVGLHALGRLIKRIQGKL